MAGRLIKVLVVDDSAIVRKLIPKALAGERDIEVVGTAVDPYNARDLILDLEPDIITLDIEMPRMDGLTFLKILMEKHPMPVIVLSSLTQRGSVQAVEALRLGAVDVLPKPKGSFSLGETGQRLGDTIRGVMQAKLRHGNAGGRTGVSHVRGAGVQVPAGTRWGLHQIGLIGASTGGTEAIRSVLRELPGSYPGLCIVQHIPAFISGAFAERLNQESAMEVREAKDGDRVKNGLALIAPGDYHIILERDSMGFRVRLKQGPKVWYQRPAVDVLFKSAAGLIDRSGVGVVLTGMGRDGAEGLLKLRESGVRTIAKDEATSVVYGMPKVANEIGGADEVVPLPDIASRMTSILAGQPKLNR